MFREEVRLHGYSGEVEANVCIKERGVKSFYILRRKIIQSSVMDLTKYCQFEESGKSQEFLIFYRLVKECLLLNPRKPHFIRPFLFVYAYNETNGV